MKIGIVTTFSDKGYDEYGKYFVLKQKDSIEKRDMVTHYYFWNPTSDA